MWADLQRFETVVVCALRGERYRLCTGPTLDDVAGALGQVSLGGGDPSSVSITAIKSGTNDTEYM